jgi:tetratricopeptide (TPR) repeat protein
VLGWLYCFQREYDKAIAEGERAIALNPSGAMVHSMYGLILTFAGRPNEAVPLLNKAIRLNPFHPGHALFSLGHAYRDTGRFEEALSSYKKVLQISPNSFGAHIYLAALYGIMGRQTEAHAEAAEVLLLNPKFSLDHFEKVLSIYRDQAVRDNIIGALRKAGLK